MRLQNRHLRGLFLGTGVSLVMLPLMNILVSRPDLYSVHDVRPTRRAFVVNGTAEQPPADPPDDPARDGPPPIWSSAYARQHHAPEAPDALRWWTPNADPAGFQPVAQEAGFPLLVEKAKAQGVDRRVSVARAGPRSAVRSGKELLARGLGAVLPYYGAVLPRVRFDPPFDADTRVEIALVPDLVDCVLDLHECASGRNTSTGEIVRDGYYNVCFPPTNDTGRRAFRRHCRGKGLGRTYGHPAPGYELWSCGDTAVMEQMVAALILDYLLLQWDRFYTDHTNNLFFLRDRAPARFVSVDHDGPELLGRAGKPKASYERWVRLKVLLAYNMPAMLRDELRAVRLRGSQEDFVRAFNASVDGQLDGLTRVLVCPKKFTPGPVGTALTSDTWWRLKSVVDFYNITLDE